MSVENLFLTLHFITWVLILLTYIELHSLKKEVRMYVDYETSLRKKRKELRNGDK